MERSQAQVTTAKPISKSFKTGQGLGSGHENGAVNEAKKNKADDRKSSVEKEDGGSKSKTFEKNSAKRGKPGVKRGLSKDEQGGGRGGCSSRKSLQTGTRGDQRNPTQNGLPGEANEKKKLQKNDRKKRRAQDVNSVPWSRGGGGEHTSFNSVEEGWGRTKAQKHLSKLSPKTT